MYAPGQSLEVKLGRTTSVTWEAAVATRDELQRRADNDLPLEEKAAPLFREWAKDWLGRKAGLIRRPDTPKVHLDVHLIPEFGSSRLDAISAAGIERWISAKRSEGVSPGYLKRMVGTLKAILNDGIREGLLSKNPATIINPIKGIKARERFLEADEIIRLLDAASEIDTWLYNAVVWALHSGMRIGEIQELRWNDIKEIEKRAQNCPPLKYEKWWDTNSDLHLGNA